jgi:hypothetical protein
MRPCTSEVQASTKEPIIFALYSPTVVASESPGIPFWPRVSASLPGLASRIFHGRDPLGSHRTIRLDTRFRDREAL